MQKKQESNIIISKDLIIYNAKTLYDNDANFRMPSYLVNEVVDNNRKLILRHKGENIRHYSPDELLKAIVSVDKKTHTGVFKRQPIEFNITVFKI